MNEKRKPKNPISKVRTGTGDSGITYFRGMELRKDDALIEFVGTLDEACAALALCDIGFDIASSGKEAELQRKIRRIFEDVIKTFFVVGALVHSPKERNGYMIEVEELQLRMEDIMNEIIDGEYVEPLEGFIIPNPENADLFFARTVVRRLERTAIRANETDFIPYLNTLSDFIFTISWYTSRFFESWTGLKQS